MRIDINQKQEVHMMSKLLSDLLPGEKGIVKKVTKKVKKSFPILKE